VHRFGVQAGGSGGALKAREVLIYAHSIINKPSKPAWLKDLAVIDMGLYRRFYRQKRRSFAGAGDGAICGASTLSTSLSIDSNHTLQAFAVRHGMLPT